MPCKRLQPCHRPSANSLTLVPAGTTEYIAAGDSQAAVPFPTEIRRDFDLQWKTVSSLSSLLLQLGRNSREASLPEKGATEATSCPKGGNMWRHWYGLTQAWSSTTYDWILWQILPRCREEACQQNLTESSVKEKTQVYHEGNLTNAWEEATLWSEPSPPGGTARLETGTPRRQPPLSSGPTSVWRQPSISADLRGRQRAAQSFWSSGCGPRICAMLLRDTATLRPDLPPPRAVLAGSPPDRGRAWWEPWARIQAGVTRQRESRPARTQGTLRLPKTLGGPRHFWWKWAQSGVLS